MTHLPRWKRNGGRDFVFYDAHPGFVSGHSAQTFVGMLCNEFRHSTHIIVERAQRNTCQVKSLAQSSVCKGAEHVACHGLSFTFASKICKLLHVT